MVSAERQRIIESNKSLRIIKNELESLLEKGALTEDVFDNIHALLPTEASISSNVAAAMASLSISPAPPSYSQSTGDGSNGAAAPPRLPGRNPSPQPPSRPVLAHARALYAYSGQDARDCALEHDDRVAVLEYMNADWWMGRNLRTGQEGIFPRNYVQPEPDNGPSNGNPWGGPNNGNEKAQHGGGYYDGGGPYMTPAVQQQPQYAGGGCPAQPAPSPSPYNASVAPMAVAEQGSGQQQGGESKLGGAGKKFGKKLGNAAIFGAGASIGSNIINSIF